ncbi:hypothetical protein [Streptomyces anthocyanicus]|uniref:hypothetical protein n=1 Tax=Streptomyces anthocyanicus TaxID=68174 RepID=UPI0038265688
MADVPAGAPTVGEAPAAPPRAAGHHGRRPGRAPPGAGAARGGRRYSQLHVHGTSKLVGLLATVELARRLPAGTSP